VCVFVALGTQLAMRMHHDLWPAPLYNMFQHFPIKGTIFEKVIEDTTFVSSFSANLFETFFIPRRDERDMIKMCIVVM